MSAHQGNEKLKSSHGIGQSSMRFAIDNAKMDAYPISKRITSKKDSTNVPEVMTRVESGLLF